MCHGTCFLLNLLVQRLLSVKFTCQQSLPAQSLSDLVIFTLENDVEATKERVCALLHPQVDGS